MHSLVILIAKYFVVIPVVAWLFLLSRLGKQQRTRFVIFSVVAAVAAAVLIKISAMLHQDPRPFVRDHVQPYFAHGNDNGFPSDHTTFSAVIALVVMRYRLWMGLFVLGVAVLIGASRVIAGVHHGQDIIGGLACAATAVGLTWFAAWAVRRVRK